MFLGFEFSLRIHGVLLSRNRELLVTQLRSGATLVKPSMGRVFRGCD
jgi:hypothetical protein